MSHANVSSPVTASGHRSPATLYVAVIHEHTRQCEASQPKHTRPRVSRSTLHTPAILRSSPTVTSTMSSSPPGQTSTSSSNFKSILDTALSHALSEYKKKTGNQLLDHPLATEVQRCDSVDAILAILQGQAEAFQEFRAGDQRLIKWISPMVDVLYTFSETLGGVAGMVRP